MQKIYYEIPLHQNPYSQTCEQRPPLGPQKSGRLKKVPDKTEIYTGR